MSAASTALVLGVLLVAAALVAPDRRRLPTGTGTGIGTTAPAGLSSSCLRRFRMRVARLRRWRVRATARTEDAAATAELLGAARLAERVSVLLRAGVAPVTAWHLGATDNLLTATEEPRDLRESLAMTPPMVQAVWELAERTGAPAADALDAAAVGLRAEADARAAVRVAMAGAKVSARTVSLLPLVGLALGAVLGAPPWEALTGSTAGRLSGSAGALLLLTGRWWSERLLRSALDQRP